MPAAKPRGADGLSVTAGPRGAGGRLPDAAESARGRNAGIAGLPAAVPAAEPTGAAGRLPDAAGGRDAGIGGLPATAGPRGAGGWLPDAAESAGGRGWLAGGGAAWGGWAGTEGRAAGVVVHSGGSLGLGRRASVLIPPPFRCSPYRPIPLRGGFVRASLYGFGQAGRELPGTVGGSARIVPLLFGNRSGRLRP